MRSRATHFNLLSLSALIYELSLLKPIATTHQSFDTPLHQLVFDPQPPQQINHHLEDFQPGSCPAHPPTSCHIPSSDQSVNSCCTNTPGGQLLLTQFWDTHPATGPSDSWTIHGLWPDNCDGTYEATCDHKRLYHNITEILDEGGGKHTLEFMKKYWQDQHGNHEQFWQHEWGKHGTCISTLEPHCMASSYAPQSEVVTFFNRTVELFQNLPTYEWLKSAGIVPTTTKTYSLAELQAVSKEHTGLEAVWNCRGHVLNEVWWHFNTVGTIADGKFIHAEPVGPRSTCPYNGIQYLPKGNNHDGGGGDHDPKRPPSHPHDPSPSRKHFIYVLDSEGKRDGCLISTGNWYRHGTCASYSISFGAHDSILDVSTRKGACAFDDKDVFTCSKGTKSAGFAINGTRLSHEGQQVFYAANLPDGRSQAHVTKQKAKHTVYLEIAAAAAH